MKTSDHVAEADLAKPHRNHRKRLEKPEAAALGALVFASVVTGLHALLSGWVPMSDEALMEMLVQAVPGDMPLTGVYSRFGWDHPGPAQIIFLAIPYRLLGSVSASLQAGTMLFHLLALVAAFVVARRFDRITGLLVLVGLQIALLSMIPSDVIAPWNPYVAIVTLGAVAVMGWGVACRHQIAALLMLPMASLLIQSHVGNTPVVAVVVVASLALMALPQGQQPDMPVPWRFLGIGVAVAALMWLPPLIAEFTRDSGNLRLILSDTLRNDDPRLGVSGGLSQVSHLFSLHPDWLGRSGNYRLILDRGSAIPVLLIVPLAAIVMAVRAKDGVALRILSVSVAATVGAFVAAASVRGAEFGYLTVGNRSVALILVVASVAVLLRQGHDRSRSKERPGGIVLSLAVASVALSIFLMVTQLTFRDPFHDNGLRARAAAEAIIRDSHGEPVELSSSPSVAALAFLSGVYLQLDKKGVDVMSPAGAMAAVGRRRPTHFSPRPEYLIGDQSQRAYLAGHGWRIIDAPGLGAGHVAAWDPPLLAVKDTAESPN